MLPMSSLIVRQGRYLQSSYRDRENYFPALVRERNITSGIATLCVSDRTLFWSILMPAIYGKFREERNKHMKCPFCGDDNTRVIDSRPADDNEAIRRRRQCDECGKRFTTYEKVETIPLIVIKKDKNRETYDRRKIEAGVIKSCHKRPVSAEAVTKCIDDIENEIFNLEVKEVDSTQIGEIVMDKIKDLDQVAYVRFASVYREFKDVNTFMDELTKLLSQ